MLRIPRAVIPAFAALFLAAGPVARAPRPEALPFRPSPVPGGVAVVPLPGGRPGEATYHGQPLLSRQVGRGWVAIVGIPLDAKPGPDALEADGRTVAFTIRPKRYPVQRVHVADPRLVTPGPEEEARIARERLRIGPAWKARPEGLVPSLVFRRPTPGDLTASFGLRRIFNGEPRSPHAGLDIRAPQGQAVRAPAAGVVVLTGDFFFSGNAVFIAHGEGVVSLLCHLSKIEVKEGQVVKAGDLVGEVGRTGRASGPHLHWSLSLNDARVDPRLFLGSRP